MVEFDFLHRATNQHEKEYCKVIESENVVVKVHCKGVWFPAPHHNQVNKSESCDRLEAKDFEFLNQNSQHDHNFNSQEIKKV